MASTDKIIYLTGYVADQAFLAYRDFNAIGAVSSQMSYWLSVQRFE
jgi:hypothetical protein